MSRAQALIDANNAITNYINNVHSRYSDEEDPEACIIGTLFGIHSDGTECEAVIARLKHFERYLFNIYPIRGNEWFNFKNDGGGYERSLFSSEFPGYSAREDGLSAWNIWLEGDEVKEIEDYAIFSIHMLGDTVTFIPYGGKASVALKKI